MANSASAPSSHHVVSMPIFDASSISCAAMSASVSTSIIVPRVGGTAARRFFEPSVASMRRASIVTRYRLARHPAGPLCDVPCSNRQPKRPEM
jgi:hypothetical protein